MGRKSHKQHKKSRKHLESVQVVESNVTSRQFINPMCQPIGNRLTDTTKETLNQRVSLPDLRTREGSPLGEAASSRSSGKSERQHSSGEGLLEQAQTLFSSYPVLYSVDVHGRRSPIDTSRMSDAAYQQLLEAAQNPLRFDGSDYPASQPESEPVRTLPPGYRLGPETGLPIPEWWTLPARGASSEEIKATLRQNLELANKRQEGCGWKRVVGRAL